MCKLLATIPLPVADDSGIWVVSSQAQASDLQTSYIPLRLFYAIQSLVLVTASPTPGVPYQSLYNLCAQLWRS